VTYKERLQSEESPIDIREYDFGGTIKETSRGYVLRTVLRALLLAGLGLDPY